MIHNVLREFGEELFDIEELKQDRGYGGYVAFDWFYEAPPVKELWEFADAAELARTRQVGLAPPPAFCPVRRFAVVRECRTARCGSLLSWPRRCCRHTGSKGDHLDAMLEQSA